MHNDLFVPMNRRGFLSAILASGVAPYVCTAAGVLMPVKKLAVLEFGSVNIFSFGEIEGLRAPAYTGMEADMKWLEEIGFYGPLRFGPPFPAP